VKQLLCDALSRPEAIKGFASRKSARSTFGVDGALVLTRKMSARTVSGLVEAKALY
jgi:hypothetical protein